MAPPPPILFCSTSNSSASTSLLPQSSPFLHAASKRKRRPAGTPDPDAEVVSLSPRTLLESDRYVCEICNQGFQRDQNLQMHRRRHKVPWKLLKREAAGPDNLAAAVRKRVFVCPEPSCLHHNPGHALGDLVGIKKHFRRKHSDDRRWVCARCSKAYAVQSDYKAHLKTCGTRGHSCDCGRVFSRVETFIEHQDACVAARTQTELRAQPANPPPSKATPISSPSQSADTNLTMTHLRRPNLRVHLLQNHPLPISLPKNQLNPPPPQCPQQPNLELQLLPPTMLELSIGRNGQGAIATCRQEQQLQQQQPQDVRHHAGGDQHDQLQLIRLAEAEKAKADEARSKARGHMEAAEEEFLKAKRLRQQAQAELSNAHLLRDHAVKQINAILLQITCHACRQHMINTSKGLTNSDENFLNLIATCDHDHNA